MLYRLLADVVVLGHFIFVLFAVLGGFLVLKWAGWAWIHVPTALWAALIEFAGWTCPLTPLENFFREKGGAAGYNSGFIEHYLLPVLYPDALTRSWQIFLGCIVLGINLAVYGWVWRRFLKTRS